MAEELKQNNMKRSGYKMKGYTYPGTSPLTKKPSKQELRDAANDPNHPNHPSKYDDRADYEAWKGGVTIVKKEKSDMYHGAGGKIMNPDGTVNKEATEENVA